MTVPEFNYVELPRSALWHITLCDTIKTVIEFYLNHFTSTSERTNRIRVYSGANVVQVQFFKSGSLFI